MFRSLFRPYGPVWNFLNHVTDVLGLSLLWCLCCLPVVTIGPDTTALDDAVVRGIRYGEEGVYGRFLRTFRAELRTGIPATLIWGVILLFGAWVLALLQEAGQEDAAASLMAGAYHAVLAIPVAAACWSVMMPSRVPCSFRELLVLSVRYLPAHLLPSVLIAAFTWLVFWYCCQYPIGLTFAPAVCVLCWSFAAERVFAKYGAGLQNANPEDADPQ